jgi:DNA end-binding protein Ku
VTIAVELYSAVEAQADIGFNLIHAPSGKWVNITKTVQASGRSSRRTSSRAIERDQYVSFTIDELDAVKLETKKTLDVSEFVSSGPITSHRLMNMRPRAISSSAKR